MQYIQMNSTAINPNLTYRVKQLGNDGFMALCTANPEISIYAKKEDEIEDRINLALQGYITLFPYKVDRMLVEDRSIRIKREQ